MGLILTNNVQIKAQNLKNIKNVISWLKSSKDEI